MPERIVLPSGGWIDLLDRAQITERHRRAARLAIMGISPEARAVLEDKDSGVDEFTRLATQADLAQMFVVNDIVAAGSICAWSYPPTPPLTPDQITDLPGGDYDAVLEATSKLGGAFFGVDFSPSTEPTSPT